MLSGEVLKQYQINVVVSCLNEWRLIWLNGIMSCEGYNAKITYSEEDECFYGEVIGLSKNSITFEGTSVKNLQREFKNAIDDYLKYCEDVRNKSGKRV